jgi:membrane protease YdiL (CAAX protease family)
MPIILALVSGGRAGLKDLTKKLLNCSFNPLWWVVAILIFPLLSFLSSGLATIIEAPRIAGVSTAGGNSAFAITTELVILSIIAPFLEEIGWRGYAMVMLRKKYDAFASTLLIGVLWGLWHFPTVFLSGMMQSTIFFPGYVLNVTLLSFFFSLLFYNGNGSAILSIVLHIAANATVGLFMNTAGVATSNYVMIVAVTALLWIFGDKTMVYEERKTRSKVRIILFALIAFLVNTGFQWIDSALKA